MSETTGPQRAAFAAMINKGRGVYVGDVPRTGLRALLNDADRLAAIESQVLWRTEDMPEKAAMWSKGTHGCYWWERDDINGNGMLWVCDFAPDYRPDEPGPIWLPILDPPE